MSERVDGDVTGVAGDDDIRVASPSHNAIRQNAAIDLRMKDVTVRPRPSSASTVGRGTATARLAEERLRAAACPAAIGFDPLPAGWRWYWERQVQDRDPLTLATSAADRDDLVSGGEIHFFDSDRHAKNHGFEWDGDILLQHRKESDPLF